MTKVKDVPGCENCPMRRLLPENNFVPPKHGSGSRLVVAEAPGEEESIQREPLVGGSGKIQNMLWRKAGIQRDALTIINTINCRPPNNVYPTDAGARKYISLLDANIAVEHCYAAHVKPLIQLRNWTRIDAIGEKSLRLLTGKTDGIMKWRGSPLALKEEQRERIMPCLHPAFVMRSQDYFPIAVSDLQKGLTVPPEYYNLKPTIDELKVFEGAKWLCFDIETNMKTNQITMIGLSTQQYHATVVPYRGGYIESLKRILESAENLIGQNIVQFDIPFIEANGIRLKEGIKLWDIMLMFHLLHPDSPEQNLEFISSIYTQKPAWKHKMHEDESLYCARDVDVTIQSFWQLKPLLLRFNLEHLYEYCQVPLNKVLYLMHNIGIRTDPSRIKYIREKLNLEVKELELLLPVELKAYEKAIRVRQKAPEGTIGKSGKPIKFIHVPGTEHVVPWQSPKKVEKYLYETLNLEKQIHRKTKKSTTDKDALARLFRKTKRPEIDALRQLRAKEELLANFLKEKTVGSGRVHTNFLDNTATGRLSSSGPNLQNLNSSAKHIYVPSHEGWIFIEADFSSLENRLSAWYANDEERLKRLSNPEFNEHRWFASKLFHIDENELSKESPEYKWGKNTNHGADGGMGWKMLSTTYDIPAKDAKTFLLKWRELNYKSAEWQERIGNSAIKDGILTNAFGRKRWFWSTRTYTEAVRTPAQSTGADICFRAMISMMYDRINWPADKALQIVDVLSPLPLPTNMLLQVHDSILVECPLDMKEKVMDTMRRAMSQPWKELGGFSIPVDFKVGNPRDSWGEIRSI